MVSFTDEQRAFLLDQLHTAKLATVRKDGRPHIAPIWFDLDEDLLVFTTGPETVKGQNIKRDARVSLCVDDEQPPFAFMIIEGIATLHDDPDELLQWATRLGGRYMGTDKAEEYGRRNGTPGELLVRVTPTRIIFEKDIAVLAPQS
jgi:PPOX class probable F420-dependent enzyme